MATLSINQINTNLYRTGAEWTIMVIMLLLVWISDKSKRSIEVNVDRPDI